jgi:hypothetical protein
LKVEILFDGGEVGGLAFEYLSQYSILPTLIIAASFRVAVSEFRLLSPIGREPIAKD